MAIRKQPNPSNNLAKLEEDLDRYIAAESVEAPASLTARSTKAKRSRRIFLGAGVALLIAVVVGMGYVSLWRSSHAVSVSQPSSTKKTESTPHPKVTHSMQQYVVASEALNLTFEYPSSWKVSPASKTNSDMPITIVSPITKIEDADQASVDAKVTILIRPGSAMVDELDSHNPTIVQNSYQAAYKNPAPTQNHYPYLTFVHYDNGPQTSEVFEQIIVTGIRAFNKGEPINATALVGLDPITSMTFTHCTTHACSGTGARKLGVTQDMWQHTPLFQQALRIVESLKIQ